MKYTKFLTILLASAILFSCTKLDEELRDSLNAEASTVNAAGLLQSAYESMNSPLQDQARLWSSAEHTTDEALGPTRGPDWDDNGVWRVLHNHTWNADHLWLRDTYRELLAVQFAATTVLTKNPSAQQAAEARFIRALSTFYVLDGWDQVPYRTDLTDLKAIPPTIKGSAAADEIIKELNESLPALTEGTAIRANKDAARALLMKVYLNRNIYANRTTPAPAAAADMDQVIALADLIINNSKYALNSSYFQNFTWDNLANSKELIYALENTTGLRGGNVRFHWFCGLNYQQKPSGWNGFCTLADFYDKFEATDIRRGGTYPGVTNVSGLRSGFLVGQQYDENGVAIIARDKSPLVFTRKVALTETGTDLERTGIRVMKYLPDYTNTADQQENEKVVFRLADVMLMKAEALLRKNNAAGALTIMNQIRAARGATALATATLDNLLEERGRELYWEGWRRNDLIRFGKFLQPIVPAAGLTSTRPTASGPERLLFTIPNQQLAVNPNLTQNPGYQ